MSILTTLGTGSGIDTARLITDLSAAQREPRLAALTQRSERTQARISALGQVRAGLDAFVGALDSLSKSGALGPQPRSGDATIVGVTRNPAVADPAPLSASIEVVRLAAAQTLTSARRADAAVPVGFGTLTFQSGRTTTAAGDVTAFAADAARPPVTITIDATNDSLGGLRDAINAAKAGVTASIVNDGVGARLVLKGVSGAADGFTVTAAATAGSPAGLGLADFGFAPGASELDIAAEATDARMIVDGLAVERATNLITDVVAGYTLDLKRAAVATPVALSAARDPEQLRAALSDFVGAYNEVNSLIAAFARPGSAREAAGALYGQSAVRQLRAELQGLTARPLASGTGGITLAEVGVRTARDGSLSVDGATLDAAIAADPALLEKLFAPSQAADATGVSITSAQGAAKPGQYALSDIVAATAARLTGAAVPGAFDFPIAVDATNASFTAMLDGLGPLLLNLSVGSYTNGAALASAFQNAINSNPQVLAAGRAVTVGWDSGRFLFLSRYAGSRSAVTLAGLDATLAARTGLDAAVEGAGSDAAGKIGGVAAIGNGSRLSASAASAASGLVLEIGSAALATGNVRVSEGLSGALGRIRDSLSRGSGGLVAANDGYARESAAQEAEAEVIDSRALAYEEGLRRQFNAMDRAVAAYKSVGEFLTQQIDYWSKPNR